MDKFCVTRKSLILRASDPEDHSAFEEFALYYDPFISVILHKMDIKSSDFSDLKQELLVKLWKKLKLFDIDHDKSSFRGWLRTVIRNSVFEYFRKKGRDKNVELTDSLERFCGSDENNELDALIDEEWKKHVIQIAMDHVSKLFTGHAIEVFQLTMEGVAVQDIAEKFSIRESSVYNLRSRVKEKFQQELKNIRELLEFPDDSGE